MDRRTSRSAGLLAAGAAIGAAGLLAGAVDASAGPKELSRKKQAAVVGRVEVPLGLQGLRGAGANVIVPFSLVDASRARSDVEVQFGLDLNSDGSITDDEYRAATEDRLDPRDTRRNRAPNLFVTAGDIGAAHAFSWRSTADVQSARYETIQYQYTDQGRLIPDTNHPGESLFDDAQAGVRIRVRALRGSGRNKLVGAWAYTDAFSLNNNTAPSMTIDQILPNATGIASDENVEILWTAIDPDSEDANNNGVFDPGEDKNGNGIFDQEQVGVAFDYYRLQVGDNPAAMTNDQIAALTWAPCTRAAGLGNTDSFRATGADRVFGTAGGRAWRFVWNSIADVGTVSDKFIVRARPVDQKHENGDYVYQRTPFTLDNLKVFTSGSAGSADIALSGARVGATTTNLVYGLDRSDSAYGKPFQQIIVAGGAATAAGAAVTGVDVFLVNSETADSTSAERVSFASFTTARKFHTATALTDGRILFAGGFDSTGAPTATTEIYDPATRTMTAGPTMATARGRHTAVRLTSNDVAFFGGVGPGGALDSIEIYHFSDAGLPLAFPVNTLAGTLAVPQHSARVSLLPDQRVLIVGGISGTTDDSGAPVATAQIFDPLAGPVDAGTPGAVKGKTPTVSNSGTMLEPRKLASATSLLDGNVLFAGGVDGGSVKATLEVYNWQTGTFQAVSVPMPDGGRCQHIGSLLGDGTVLLAGGATTDPTTGGTPSVTRAADVFRLGTLTGSTWSATFLDVNGDMVVGRRGASDAVTMNGRAFIAGGSDASGNAIATAEVYTPAGSFNRAPKAYVYLPTGELSHSYGATIYYRLIDAESDRARVIVQFRLPGASTWNACTPQANTIGGDVAESTANLATTPTDRDELVLAIDPIARNTPGDHAYIWSMMSDIDRPNPGATISGYNVRVVPFGAVRGTSDVSDPVNVLYNTKPLIAIMPLEDSIGVANPRQGGDVQITVHVRDIDGPGTGARAGDDVSVLFEYAVDANSDGQLTGTELFGRMTPATEPVVGPQPNPVLGAKSWSESSQSPLSDPATRPTNKGWLNFSWDALYDLGPTVSTKNWEAKNIWIRATAADANTGFPQILRNLPGQPDSFVYTRDAQALWLESFAPIQSTKTTVKVNEPVVFQFNGNVNGATVNATTFQIYRGATSIKGQFVTKNNTPVAGKSTVTFYPQTQELNTGSQVYGVNDASTILFPFNQYSFKIPGYTARVSPLSNVPPTIKAIASGNSTFQLVNSGPIDGTADAAYRFTTTTGTYNDGQPVSFLSELPAFNSLPLAGPAATSGFSLSYTHALDVTSVTSPNVIVRGASGQSYVVPGRWSVTNTFNPDGTTKGTITFVPLNRLPSGDSIIVSSTAGLKGTNGLGSTAFAGGVYPVSAYGRAGFTLTESFTNTNRRDSTGTTATWGSDLCAPGTLTGLQDSGTQPAGGAALVVNSGVTTTLTLAAYDYASITVNRGGTLKLQCASGPMTIRTTGDITINGIVDFSGADGDHGAHGYGALGYPIYGPTYTTTTATAIRNGGTGVNGGGSGGASRWNTSTTLPDNMPGDNGVAGFGTTGTGGTGGRIPNVGVGVLGTPPNSYTSSTYMYGAGGGAGGAHARDGFDGGICGFNSASTPQGVSATRGLATTTAADFSSGITGGGGGGGGGAMEYFTSSAAQKYFHTAGAGGAGAGAVLFLCNGTFRLGPAGYINGQGGEGGQNSHFSGCGGGGSGGGVWIKSGNQPQLDGLIDLRGGRGGAPSFAYYGDSYIASGAWVQAAGYGTVRYGGDGGPGRLVVEGPTFLAANINEVRVFGSLTVRQTATIPTTALGASTVPTAFTTSGGTGTFNLDLGGTTDIRYASLDIPAGRIVKFRNGSTPATSRAIRIYVDGTVNIGGTLDFGANGTGLTTNGSFSVSGDVSPLNSSSAYYTMYGFNYVYSYNTPPTAYTTGYYGVVGGGDGGAPMGGGIGGAFPSGSLYYEGKDGTGPTPGKFKFKIGQGYATGYYMHTGDFGGSGAGNASPGRIGWTTYAAPYHYNYSGAALDTTGTGVPAAQRRTDAAVGGGVADASLLTTTTIANFAGSGGGGGNAGGWPYQYYYGSAGMAGGGGGAVAIICQGNVNVTGTGTVRARGGDGTNPGVAYPYYYAHAGGGGGSGGTCYLVGNNISISAVTIGEGTSANGATFDVSGGFGGGFRQPFSGVQKYPWYNSFGNFGGDGGFGRVVLEYKTSINSGKVLVNRWGNEAATFYDSSNSYRTTAGQATYKCRGLPGQTTFRSTFVDLGSLRPQVTGLYAGTIGSNAVVSFQGQGAQSHPHNPGVGGTGEADPSVLSSIVTGTTSGMTFDGFRWWRFSGTLSRLNVAVTAPPVVDNVTTTGVTDSGVTVISN
ncbi:MAG: hypothetical protein K8T90_12615 [Planctomycetes bacterium]|nr:hypothetical protein [Planctomycetota bacterium]